MTKIVDSHMTVDENGEMKEWKKVSRFKSEEPNYIKVYLQDISYFYEVPKGSTDLVYELFNYVNYNTHEIIINSDVKKRISENMNSSVATIDNNLSKLVKKGIIDRVGRGIFTLNPYLFGKGDWKSIKDLRDRDLHLEITYNKDTNKRELRGKVGEQSRMNFKNLEPEY